MTKTCFACKVTKPTSEFYATNQKADGLSTYCKPCFIAKQKKYVPRSVSPKEVYPEGIKRCHICKELKPVGDFGKNCTNKDGLQYACKPCQVASVTASRRKDPTSHRRSSKAWREKNVERHADNNARWRYGVEHGTYAKMLAEQNGRCAICKTETPGGRAGRFHIDHCHDTGVIRGLLCTNCNTGLGQLKHDPDLIRKAIEYLK